MKRRAMLLGRFGAGLMAILLVLSLVPMTAFAATWTKKSLKTIYSSDSLSTQIKKSTKIKKAGRYGLVMRGGNGIVKFSAPKAKTYKFTFGRLKSSEVNDVACVIGMCNAKGVYRTKIVTKEGKRPRLPIVSASMANGKTFQLDGYRYQSVKTRTAKIKLKKGQSVYIVFSARNMSDSQVSSTMRMRIQ